MEEDGGIMRIVNSLPSKQQLIIRSLVIAGGLTLFKASIFGVTNSVAILASAADSLMDLLISFANFVFLKRAAKPADENHAYGYGKIESLAGLIQSLVMGAVIIGVAGSAVRRFYNPQEVHQPMAAMLVISVALAFNLWHVRNLRRSMLTTGSQVMATEYLHYVSDIYVYLGVIASLVLVRVTSFEFWDPLISLLIVVYLVKSVVEIFNQSLEELLDKQLADPVIKELDQLIRHFDPRIIDYHDLRTRKVGDTKFIEFHVELRGIEKFHDAHDLTEALIQKIRDCHPGAIVTVHADPEGGI